MLSVSHVSLYAQTDEAYDYVVSFAKSLVSLAWEDYQQFLHLTDHSDESTYIVARTKFCALETYNHTKTFPFF